MYLKSLAVKNEILLFNLHHTIIILCFAKYKS